MTSITVLSLDWVIISKQLETQGIRIHQWMIPINFMPTTEHITDVGVDKFYLLIAIGVDEQK